MRKTLIILGCMSLGMAHAQQGRTHTQHNGAVKRIGINTEKPVASLEVSKVSGVPTTQVQGFLLPHLNQTERNEMQKEALTNGLMIFNTTKNCIDWWDGTNWQCMDGSNKDEHGDVYAKYRATSTYTATTEFTKNDCPIGQDGSKVNFTPSAPIVGKGYSDISQQEAQRLAEENAKAEFDRLGQQYANVNGTCTYSILGKTQAYGECGKLGNETPLLIAHMEKSKLFYDFYRRKQVLNDLGEAGELPMNEAIVVVWNGSGPDGYRSHTFVGDKIAGLPYNLVTRTRWSRDDGMGGNASEGDLISAAISNTGNSRGSGSYTHMAPTSEICILRPNQ